MSPASSKFSNAMDRSAESNVFQRLLLALGLAPESLSRRNKCQVSRRPERARAFFIFNDRAASEVHAAHASSAGPARHRWALLLRQLGDHGLGRDEQARDP